MSSNVVKRWAGPVALAMPIVVSAGLSLWFTRPAVSPPRLSAAAADAAEDTDRSGDDNGKTARASDSSDLPGDIESREAAMRRRRAKLLASQPSSTVNENEAAEALLERYAPHTWKRLERMPADGPVRMKLQRQLMERARDLQRMEKRDPEQFKSEVEQVKLEDEVADLGRQVLRRGDSSSSSSDQDAIKKTLHESIEKLVDVRLRNRQARLDRLAKTLETEKDKLETDRDNRDKLVQRQFDTVVNGRRQPFGQPGAPGEGRPAFAAPNGPRRGPGASRPGNEPKADVQASPDRSRQSDSTPDDDKSK
jgi:hypothetical protein